jgi:hypothetical protein
MAQYCRRHHKRNKSGKKGQLQILGYAGPTGIEQLRAADLTISGWRGVHGRGARGVNS